MARPDPVISHFIVLITDSPFRPGHDDESIVDSNNVARRCFMLSAIYSASAWIVQVGFTPPDVTKMLPSTMNRFFTS